MDILIYYYYLMQLSTLFSAENMNYISKRNGKKHLLLMELSGELCLESQGWQNFGRTLNVRTTHVSDMQQLHAHALLKYTQDV